MIWDFETREQREWRRLHLRDGGRGENLAGASESNQRRKLISGQLLQRPLKPPRKWGRARALG
ncbi:hypothetical protein E2C01_026860 [Portunus trituberculatus]|uniref:Uncharacterized protein n=1 Tax=Portunus trituberculatus TaxID=210409 RepID=A0A5B7EJJ4_PORTR|nr:hypothetical protein [Portunus trituberculatus]